eukprot:TRINITY_DN1274_c0_g1_i1.p1 TRINITY_DN1274_c0_g1~~TRINITY_DN1274_c0_g1_i1.p1  ORF type:complete len:295 (-),score=43.62 TRINITY_DN1274_c0_g1_i1:110-922(-)
MISVVTGANRGIGYTLCKMLLEQGSKVILTSRDEAKGKEAVYSLLKSAKDKDKLKDRLFYYPLDVSNPDSIHNFAQALKHDHHRCDYLFNNAAIFRDGGWTQSIFEEVMDTNVRGVIHLTNAILPLMKENKFGRIVNVSSGVSKLGSFTEKYRALLTAEGIEQKDDEFFLNFPFLKDEMKKAFNPTYQLSKALVNAYSRAVAYRLAKEKLSDTILVNSCDPGWIQTDMGGPSATYPVERGSSVLLECATIPNGGFTGKFLSKGPIETSHL